MTQLPANQLIITRPKGQGDSLVQALLKVNTSHIIKHLPLMSIQSLEFSLSSALHFDAAIFISTNAVDYFYHKEKLENTRLFAVGNRTAERLEQISHKTVTFPQQMNSEGLLALTELSNVDKQQWLIVKGIGGRTTLIEQLKKRGATVVSLDVYQRTLPSLSEQQSIIKAQSEQAIWIITSAKALTNLHRILGLMNAPKHQTQVIVSSERLALLAKQKGFTIVAQSAGASEAQLVQCVKTLIDHRQQ